MISSSTDTSHIRKFGLIALLFFGILCALGAWRQKILITYFFGVLYVIGLGLFLLPAPLRPIYNGWLNVAHLIGRVITAIILTLTYYFVITPSAGIKRMFGGCPIPVRPDKNVLSYWIVRTEPAQPKERFIKRY